MSDHDLHVGDEQLLARLRRVADAVDPVPDDVVELGRAAFALRHADTALMALVTEALSEVAVREADGSGTASHLIGFEHEGTSIEIEVSRRGDFTRVIGVVMDGTEPYAAGSEVVLETSASQTRVALDEGRFTFERVPLGLARVVLEHAGHRVMSTRWFEAR
jgi:hypothetical protein